MPNIIIHLKTADMTRPLSFNHLQLYGVIKDMSAGKGFDVIIRQRDEDIKTMTRQVPDDRFNDGNLHIIDDRCVNMANVLNAGVAYFWRFWHIDPKGTKAFSSIGDLVYHPTNMPFKRAKPFYDRMRHRYVHGRMSRYEQARSHETFPRGAIALFFQGSHPRLAGATDFTDLGMLATVMEQAGDRPIIVKPHPLLISQSDLTLLEDLKSQDERLIVTNANIHDILGACDVTVSINSTVALEGFLHRKPAILFGKSDFHHFASTVTVTLGFSQALDIERNREDGFAQYIAWYLMKHCLSQNRASFVDDIWKVFAKAGVPKERFL